MAKKGTDAVWQNLRRKLLSNAETRAKVGILADAGKVEGGSISVAQLGTIHEYGAPKANIPERSFIRSTFDNRKDELKKLSESLGKKVFEDRRFTVGKALDALGQWGTAAVKKTIVEKIPPALKPATIERKGSDTPLVASGQLINSISYEIVK